MAKQMPYDDQFGNHYDTSYWRLVQASFGIADRNAMVQFYGYRDEPTRRAGKQSIGSKSYSVSGETFDKLMTEHLKPGGPNIGQLAYKVAMETKDTGEGENKHSFFEGAEDLL